MPELVEQLVESPEPERLATGFEFTEGPVWSVDGSYWLFVDIRRSLIFRMAPGRSAGGVPRKQQRLQRADLRPPGPPHHVRGRRPPA